MTVNVMYEWMGSFLSIDFINALHKRSFTGSWHFCNNVTFMWYFGTFWGAPVLLCPPLQVKHLLSSDSTLSVRTAKGRGGLAFLISLCHLVWSAGLGSVPCQEGAERRWLKDDPFHLGPGINSSECMRFVCSLCSLASVNLLHTHLWPIWREFFRGIMAGSQFKPDLSVSHPQVHVATQDWLPLSFSTGLHLTTKGDSWKTTDPWHSVIYIMS